MQLFSPAPRSTWSVEYPSIGRSEEFATAVLPIVSRLRVRGGESNNRLWSALSMMIKRTLAISSCIDHRNEKTADKLANPSDFALVIYCVIT